MLWRLNLLSINSEPFVKQSKQILPARHFMAADDKTAFKSLPMMCVQGFVLLCDGQ
jgi:hypothetical protein